MFNAFLKITPLLVLPFSIFIELLNANSYKKEVSPKKPSSSICFECTKWCGSGNVANHYNDLGTHTDTDVCCREHDSCPEIIQSGQTSHGLTNNAVYTRLHCDCDEKFLNCLKDSSKDHRSSKMVGIIYFDALQTQCYRYEYPVVGCSKYSNYPQRCMEYIYNTSAEKTWQWFDVPYFQ